MPSRVGTILRWVAAVVAVAGVTLLIVWYANQGDSVFQGDPALPPDPTFQPERLVTGLALLLVVVVIIFALRRPKPRKKQPPGQGDADIDNWTGWG